MTPEERRKRMEERMAAMTPEERAAFQERMAARMAAREQGAGPDGRGARADAGGGRGGFGGGFGGGQAGAPRGAERTPGGIQGAPAEGGRPAGAPQGRVASVPAMRSGATTIDSLFGPLPTVETRGRAWLYINKQLKPVSLRLGISDGTNTEVLDGGELQVGTEVVTNVVLPTTTTAPAGASGAGQNPLMGPQRGGPGPGGNRGGGGGRGF